MLKVKKEIRREYFEGKTMSWEVVKEMEDKANETGELLCVVIGNSIVINSSYYPACDSACSLERLRSLVCKALTFRDVDGMLFFTPSDFDESKLDRVATALAMVGLLMTSMLIQLLKFRKLYRGRFL